MLHTCRAELHGERDDVKLAVEPRQLPQFPALDEDDPFAPSGEILGKLLLHSVVGRACDGFPHPARY